MKKITAIVSLVIGIMALSFSNVNAINPASLTAEVLMQQYDISLEDNIIVQDWMLNFEEERIVSENVLENKIKLESWMIDANWNDNNEIALESEIQLEDWMTKSFLPNIRFFALDMPLM